MQRFRLALTTSTNGRGTWTLTWTSDTNGSITAPDGSTTNFTIPSGITTNFADPMVIVFGPAPYSSGGYGQYIDFNSILITNVFGANESDDFTKDDVLNTNLWNPAFSSDAGSVVQVSTNTPYWVTWTATGFHLSLATKADLSNTNVSWYSPWYYSGYTTNGYAVSNASTLMGGKLYWTLIPSSCLPTVDGTTNGPVSPTAFFRLQYPPPSR